ncbi:hypothetical protein MNEG_11211 [Monoraphidium neglectum]|uniref:Uncharacterized protein n=1 Tax=Monoraphidium neglectum TaxID=145388 RepID=A0A0D2JAI6_9CHLO|nr:hypothetical protein MNEG_11211 [Monoraphidium neglectum]KIY96752.1 hypothetical protein MNEG_11211 [Monoraphidium neglectum]|eukprot:XP_013895772.1 hypothetical protein MNEG_11211 [Monoraphidium neglectum]
MGSHWEPELKRTWSAACGGDVHAILLSQRGKVAAATASSVFLFDGPPKFELRRELRGQPAGLTAAAFSCKGTDVVSGGADGFLKWWQVDSGEELCSTQFPRGDGQQAVVGAGGAHDLGIPEVACSRGGFVAAVSGRLLCIFGTGGEHLHTLDVSGDAAAGALQHVTWLDENSVLGCCGSEATIWRVDEDQYEEVGTFATNPEAPITQLAMSPNGRYLAAACGNDTVQVWDAQQEGSMDPLLVISDGLGGAPVTRLAWDASSALLAAAAGGRVLVWDVAGAKEGRAGSTYALGGFEEGDAVTCLAFQPNGTLLAAASEGGLCLVFDSDAFSTSGAAPGVVAHVARGRLGGAGGAGGAPAAAGKEAPADAGKAVGAAAEGKGEGGAGGEEAAGADSAAKGEAVAAHKGEVANAAEASAAQAEGVEAVLEAAAAGAPNGEAEGAKAGGAGDAGATGDAGAGAGAIRAIAWHSSGNLVVGTSTGVVGALQPLRAGSGKEVPPADIQVDASGLRRQEPVRPVQQGLLLRFAGIPAAWPLRPSAAGCRSRRP